MTLTQNQSPAPPPPPPPPPPQLILDEQITEFQQYMLFAHDDDSTLFTNGTVFWNVKDASTEKIIRFGFTVIDNQVSMHKPGEEWDTTTFHSTPLEIHVDEHQFRGIFAGWSSKSDLCNAILGGKIYVSPWSMKSVYNFACSFQFDRWEEFYETKRLQAVAEKTRLAQEERTKAEAAAAAAAAASTYSTVVAAGAKLIRRFTHTRHTENTASSTTTTTTTTTTTDSPGPFITKSSLTVLLAGAIANSFEALVMHPLDLLKTRFQLSSQRLRVFSHLNAISRELPSSGGTPATTPPTVNPLRLWRGSFPAVAMQAPRGALKFGVHSLTTNSTLNQSSYQHLIAGGITGMSESVLITPFELIKVRLQASDKLMKYTNSFHALQIILTQEGLPSLWRGLESTLWRNGLWNAAYFGCIPFVRTNVATYAGNVITNTETQHFIAGTVGGAIGACFSTPIDVAKSRIQNNATLKNWNPIGNPLPQSTPVKTPWTIPTVLNIGQKEGIVGLYRGFVPKLLRLGPGGGLLLVTYETTKTYIENKHSV
jgi:solute carrier family 25 2-oxodicarboxylate transporter 21